MKQSELQAAIEAIWEARRQGIHYPPDWKGKLDVESGYRVQLGVLARHVKAGDRHVGWKVGLTAQAIREQTDYFEPVFGFLLESGAMASGGRIPFDDLIQPNFENELCVRIGTTLKGPGVTPEQARAAIEAVAPGLEIVEKRGPFAADPPLTLADNVQQRYFVTGAYQPVAPEVVLSDSTVQVSINGEVVDEAPGTEVQGGPENSVAWLANRLSDFGVKLEAGMQVMTGSYTRQHPIAQGDLIEAHFEPWGPVSVQFV